MRIEIKKAKTLDLEIEIELDGSPDEVWAAIATGPGISTWFVPTEVQEEPGGQVLMHIGPGMDAPAVITGWEPPHRFAYEERDWQGPERQAEPLATEFRIEARSGGTSVLRVVTSLFHSGADWEDEFFESMKKGWRPYFENLRLYMTEFRGEQAVPLQVKGVHPGTRDAAWSALLEGLGIGGAAGSSFASAAGVPPLSGTIHRVAEQELSLRLTAPAPGYAVLGAYEWEGKVHTSVQAYLFGAGAERVAAEQAPLWKRWMAENFAG